MKWYSHKITTLAMAYALTQNVLFSLSAGLLSIFPDWIETRGPLSMKHRGLSHNPLFWAVVIPGPAWAFLHYVPGVADQVYTFFLDFFSFIPRRIFPETTLSALQSVCYGGAAGIFFHLFEDYLSETGIPFPGKRKHALKLYKTGRGSEAVVVFTLVVLSVIYFYFRHNFGG
jgi:hypothetical protein